MPIPRLAVAPVLAGLTPNTLVQGMLGRACPSARLLPDQAPPCPDGMLRVETAAGRPLNCPDALADHWHRPPYVMGVRLVRYAPGSVLPEIIDHAVIGTRVDRDTFSRQVERTALHLVEDAFHGRSRGASADLPSEPAQGSAFSAWLDHTRSRWGRRLLSEWWSLGVCSASLGEIVDTGQPGPVTWLHPAKGTAYLADPFPWPGTSEILCEEMPMSGGHGRIVAVSGDGGGYRVRQTILADQDHHSYPCTFQADGITWLLPEATEPGATVLYRLDASGGLDPVCAVAPQRRLSDPTLFRHGGRYWIACADLDIGAHDNLCLLHATQLEGPWQPHRLHPARIDIRGARPAGGVFRIGEAMFRPGQNCAATYGAGITIYRIETLTPDDYNETAVAALRPDPHGPFPHGLHTLVNDGTRTWVDGKRFVLDWPSLLDKVRGRLRRSAAAHVSARSPVAGPGRTAGAAPAWLATERPGLTQKPVAAARGGGQAV